MQAELEAAKKGLPYERRHPAAVLLDAVLGSDVLLTHLLRRQAEGKLTPEESTALGWAIDRAARVSKTAIDASIESRLLAFEETRLQRSAEEIAAQTLGIFGKALRLAELTASERLTVWRGWYAALLEIKREQVWPRLWGEAVQELARQLELNARAEEAAVAIGVGDDSELEDDDHALADVAILWPRGDGVA